MVLSDDQVHHPSTRKDTLNLLVHSDLPNSPWFDAGDHRSLRAPASSVGVLNLTGGTPRQALFFSPLGGDGAANVAELDSDFSEPGKHV